MVNPMRNSPIRMMGLASGMDTDFIIQQTLRMHQFRIDNQVRNRTLVHWRQENHNSIRDEIQSIRGQFLTTRPGGMFNRSVFNSTRADVTGASSSAITVTTQTGANPGHVRIGQIHSMARNMHMQSATRASATGQSFSRTARLDSLNFAAQDSFRFSTDPQQRTATLANGNAVNEWELRTFFQNEWSSDATATARIGPTNGQARDMTVTRAGVDGSVTVRFAALEGETVDSINVVDTANVVRVPVDGSDGEYEFVITFAYNTDASDMNIRIGAEGTYADGTYNDDDVYVPGAYTRNRNSTYVTFAFDEDDDSAITINGRAGAFTQSLTIDVGVDEYGNAISETFVRRYGDENGQIFHGNRALSFASTTTLTFDIPGQDGPLEIDIRGDMSINSMIAHVNRELQGTGIVMSYDAMGNRFSFDHTGAAGRNPDSESFTVSGELLGTLGFATTNDSATATAATRASMDVFFNGVKETVTSNSNNFSFGDINIRINHTTEADSEINVALVRDASGAMDAVREFIDTYNALVQRLENMLTERRTPAQAGYRPLTDEERMHLSERQAEEWDRIARIGIMRNDRDIRSLVDGMRSTFFRQIEGAGLSASQLGLSTGNFFDNTGGQIIIDEDRLRAALESDPDRVADVFIGIQTGADGQPRGVGLLYQINDLMGAYLRNTSQTTMPALEDSLRRMNEQIERMEMRMWAEEERLHRQFAAMESAMSRLNQQADWFASMLGNM